MGGSRQAHQDRADADAVGDVAHQVVAGVGGIEVGEGQQVGAAGQLRVREDAVARFFVQGDVGVHFAFNLELGRALAQDRQRVAHLLRAGRFAGAEVAVAHQRRLGRDAEQLQAEGRLHDAFGHLGGGRIHLHVGVGEEEHALFVQHRAERRQPAHFVFQAQHFAHVLELAHEAANHAAQQRVGFATAHHQRGDDDVARAHHGLGRGRRDALALHDLVVELPVVVEARVVVDVRYIDIDADAQAQAQALDAALDHRRAADQDRPGKAFVHHRLHGAQHGFFLAFGVDHALAVGAGAVEHRLHQQAGAEHPARQAVAVAFKVFDGARGHARFHRGLGHGGRQRHQQARVEGARDQVFGAKARGFAGVGGTQVGGLAARQVGDGVHAGQLHFFVDRRRADVERAAEDVRETQGVVDLVREVAAAGGDDRVRARLAGEFRVDLGRRVGQGEDDRLVGHGLHHLRLEHATGGHAQEDVGAVDDFSQRTRRGVARIPRNAFVDAARAQVGAAGVQHAVAVDHVDVGGFDAQRHQHVQAGDAGRAGAADRQLDVGDVLADHVQRIDERGADDDGGAVLVVVEHRDLQPLAQLLFDHETLGRLDVFKVDAAEGGLEAGDDLDQLVRVVFVDFQVEHVDAGELLEQHALAFHHRLARQRADVAQAQHGGAVGDHAHQVAARGQRAGLARVGDDGFAGRGHARRIRQRQVALGHHGLGRRHLDLPRRCLAVVIEGGKLEVFLFGHGRAGGAWCGAPDCTRTLLQRLMGSSASSISSSQPSSGLSSSCTLTCRASGGWPWKSGWKFTENVAPE